MATEPKCRVCSGKLTVWELQREIDECIDCVMKRLNKMLVDAHERRLSNRSAA